MLTPTTPRMASAAATALPADTPTSIDDEIVALTLQLADINEHENTKKGKYIANSVPDLEIAYASHMAEINAHLQVLNDVKLAHSIANAVSTDAQVITELIQEENQAQQDRQAALRLNGHDAETETPPPPYAELAPKTSVEEEVQRLVLDDVDYDSDSTLAGPSEPYVRRQVNAMEKLTHEGFQCIACTMFFRMTQITKLDCKDMYCGECLRKFIMRGVDEHDLALLPPRCCGQMVSREVIADALEEDEIEKFQEAEVERNTRDKTYCSNAECGKFIAPVHIAAGMATCKYCGTENCSMCKQAFHVDDCPADPALQATLVLGNELKWQRCYSCRSMVAIETGCNHMTCRCGAEFCYQCGGEWSSPRCNCALWDEANLLQRARHVVDRVAPQDIGLAERERRVARMQDQLRDNDECNHRGKRKFERIEGGYGVPRFVCELCNARHRQFILRCKQCQLDVCMECRLHRV